jgi:hypothetical protein
MSDFDEPYRRYKEQARRYARAPFDRYHAKADHYAQLYGLNPKTQTDLAWDAFRHAYASAAARRDYGRLASHFFGDAHEVRGDFGGKPQHSYGKHMDRWNNAVGRRLAEGAADKDEIAQRVYDALKAGDLIIDPTQDARYYTGSTLVPSPNDFDRRTIHEGPLPEHLEPKPRPWRPEDHPPSLEEIEQLLRGFPK